MATLWYLGKCTHIEFHPSTSLNSFKFEKNGLALSLIFMTVCAPDFPLLLYLLLLTFIGLTFLPIPYILLTFSFSLFRSLHRIFPGDLHHFFLRMIASNQLCSWPSVTLKSLPHTEHVTSAWKPRLLSFQDFCFDKNLGITSLPLSCSPSTSHPTLDVTFIISVH